jgi:hypothetical protein
VKNLSGSAIASPTASPSPNITNRVTLINYAEWADIHGVSREWARQLIDGGKIPVFEVHLKGRNPRLMIEASTPYPSIFGIVLPGEIEGGMVPLSTWATIISKDLGPTPKQILKRIGQHFTHGRAPFVVRINGHLMVHKAMPWPYRKISRDLRRAAPAASAEQDPK